MMLRLQRERMQGSYVPSTREYFHFFGLDHEKLARAKPDALIMHPGPMNRGVEISAEVADLPRSVIVDQVRNGVATRMAVLYLLLGQGVDKVLGAEVSELEVVLDPERARSGPEDVGQVDQTPGQKSSAGSTAGVRA
jgi:hypothetical protein